MIKDIIDHIDGRDARLRKEIAVVRDAISTHASMCQKNQHAYRVECKEDIIKSVNEKLSNAKINMDTREKYVGVGFKIGFWAAGIVGTILGLKMFNVF